MPATMQTQLKATAPKLAQRAQRTMKAQSPVVAALPKVEKVVEVAQKAGSALAAAAVSLSVASGASALSYDDFQGLTYLQVKGTGIANTCPVIEADTNGTAIKAGDYKLKAFCLEPTSFTVKDDGDFEKTKLMTRLTYTLDGMTGKFKVGADGSISVVEEDGLDYAATTVQLAGGERVPFLFTVKNLNAKGSNGQFAGDFDVPSYRGASFLDPKGRGATTGYDNAVALPARADAEELLGENIKNIKPLKGSAVFNIAKYDSLTGEIAGVFESIQPSDTDMGAKVPKDIKILGLWYGQISQ